MSKEAKTIEILRFVMGKIKMRLEDGFVIALQWLHDRDGSRKIT